MNNCVEYLEIISAYVDGELTELDRHRIEAHFGVCEHCSAFLDLSREISAASTQSFVPVPEALRSGVMEKVLSAGAAQAAGSAGAEHTMQTGVGAHGAADNKARKPVRAALSRYIPVAACLAVVLLALPFVIIYYGGQTGDNASAPNGVLQGVVAPEAAAGSEWGDESTGRSGMEQLEAEAGGGAPHPAAEAALDDADLSPDSGYARDLIPLPDTPPGEPEDSSEFGSWNQEDDTAHLPDPAEALAALNELLEDVYAWIEITGELPELLWSYESAQLADPLRHWLNFDVVFRIHRDVADELINELMAQDGIDIMIINADSQYALVLYAR